MPEFGQIPALLDKPEVTFAARFDRVIYRGMRTDHFTRLVDPAAGGGRSRPPTRFSPRADPRGFGYERKRRGMSAAFFVGRALFP